MEEQKPLVIEKQGSFAVCGTKFAAKQVQQVRMGNGNHPDVIRKNQKGHETAKKWRLRHRELQNQNQHHDPVRTIQTVE